MTSVGPPQFDRAHLDEAEPASPGTSRARRWLLPMLAGVAALLVIAQLATPERDPVPTARPSQAEPSTTTVSGAGAGSIDQASGQPGYTGSGVATVVQAMSPHVSGFKGFAADPDTTGGLLLLSSPDGIRWGKEDAAAVTGIEPGAEPRGVWAIPGSGLELGVFSTDGGTSLVFATSGRGIRWQQFGSFSDGERQLRPQVVVTTPANALVSLGERGSTDVAAPLDPLLVEFGSGRVRSAETGAGEILRTAAYDPVTGAILGVLTSADEPGPPGSNHRFAWLVGDTWQPVAFTAPEPFDVVALSSWRGRIAAFTGTQVHVLDGATGTWSASEPYGPPGRVVQAVAAGPGGAAVLTVEPAIAGGGIHVGVSSDLVRWNDVEIVDELINLQIEAVGTEEVVLEAFGVGVGLQRLVVPLPPD